MESSIVISGLLTLALAGTAACAATGSGREPPLPEGPFLWVNAAALSPTGEDLGYLVAFQVKISGSDRKWKGIGRSAFRMPRGAWRTFTWEGPDLEAARWDYAVGRLLPGDADPRLSGIVDWRNGAIIVLRCSEDEEGGVRVQARGYLVEEGEIVYSVDVDATGPSNDPGSYNFIPWKGSGR